MTKDCLRFFEETNKEFQDKKSINESSGKQNPSSLQRKRSEVNFHHNTKTRTPEGEHCDPNPPHHPTGLHRRSKVTCWDVQGPARTSPPTQPSLVTPQPAAWADRQKLEPESHRRNRLLWPQQWCRHKSSNNYRCTICSKCHSVIKDAQYEGRHRDVAQWVESLPRMHEALGSAPGSA